jgi:hypothetical protein
MNRRRRLVSTSLYLALLSGALFSVSAQASTVIFQIQGRDNYDPADDVRYDHETRNMSIRVFESNKDLVVVSLTFTSNVSSTTFASSSTLLRVKFMPNLTNFKGNAGNIWLEAPKVPYQGATKIPAIASSYMTEKSSPNDFRKDMSACGALTWMDDVPGRNMVSFEFSRNCFDLPNTFWAVSQVETDIYNSSTIKDIRYTPIEPFYIDMNSVPRPPKAIPKKDQSVTAYTAYSEYFVDLTSIQVIASSSPGGGLVGGALTFNSQTPEICFVTSTGVIQPKASGICRVSVTAQGSDTLNPSAPVLVSVTLKKKSQNLYFDPPGTVFLSEGSVNLAISSEFDLPVQVVSTAPTICTFPDQASAPTTAVLLRAGNCSFKVTQAGNFIYIAREGFASFDILADKAKPQATPTAKPKPTPTPKPPSGNKPAPTPTKTGIVISGKASASGGGTGGTTITGSGSVAGDVKRTITCIKPGFKSKKVTSTDPMCPPGYKKK